jgi:subtilisin-like proprotein convertase family protein
VKIPKDFSFIFFPKWHDAPNIAIISPHSSIMQTMKSTLASVFGAFLAIPALISSAQAGLPLHEDGVYQFPDQGKLVTFRVDLTQVRANPTADLVEGFVPVSVTNLSALAAKVSALETSTQRGHALVMRRDGSPNRLMLQRKILVKFTGTLNVAAVTAAIQASGYTPFLGDTPGIGIFTFTGAASCLAGAEAALKIAGITSARPIFIDASRHKAFYVPNDPYYAYRGTTAGYGWHFKNVGVRGGTPGIDINIEQAWNTFRGTGITMSVLDDGLELNHPDLKANVIARGGWDFVDGDGDPTAGEHGTCVGGLMGAVGDNNQGVVGGAWRGRLIGYRMLGGGGVTDEDIAGAFHNTLVHVSNNSWGYPFPYITGPELSIGLNKGATRGRGGRGTLMVFAAGNSRGFQDSNDSVLTSNYWAMPVSATLDIGLPASYTTPGAANLVGGPSGDTNDAPFEMITTTDRSGGLGYNPDRNYIPANPGRNMASTSYHNGFNGTSAAAPIVSGGVALMVQAKPSLGARDVWDIIARTAQPVGGWIPGGYKPFLPDFQTRITDGVLYHTSHDAGHGMLNTSAAVTMAKTWKNLATDYAKEFEDGDVANIPPGSPAGVIKSFRIANGPRIRMEKVEVALTVEHPFPAALQVFLSSSHVPNRIFSRLQIAHGPPVSRPNTWSYTTTQHWAECAGGDWQLRVIDTSGRAGTITNVKLTLHGGPGARPILAPVISNLPMPQATEYCSAYAGYQIGASGCPLSYAAFGLPVGLRCDTITGFISGTAYESGVFPITLSARNEIGTTTLDTTLTVRPRITIPNITGGYLGIATVGEPFRLQLTANSTPMTWSFSGDNDPGFLIYTATGLIVGTPEFAGVFRFTVTATNYCVNPVDPTHDGRSVDIVIVVQPANRSIAAALDVPGQRFNMNWSDLGIAPTLGPVDTWFWANDHFVNGGDSVVSPIFAGRQKAEFYTEVVGPVRVEFDWMTSNHVDDHLNFYTAVAPAAVVATISGNSGWQHYGLDLPVGTHTLRWEYDNASAAFAGEDRGHVDHLMFIYADLATAIGWTAGPVTSYGANPWSLDIDAARSGNVLAGEKSVMDISVTGPGVLTFDWRVSSEADEDFLSFSLDDDETLVAPISGTTVIGYTPVSVNIPAGTHSARWIYTENGLPLPDPPTTDGADAGWVQNVVFTPTP